jgi:hypothetical protein
MSRLAGVVKLFGGPVRTPDEPETRLRKGLRWARIAVLIIASIVTLQSVLLVAGAWRNDRQIERHMGVAQAEVLSGGPRRSTIEFVTPNRVTYRPELGVLYPSELADGMRIYVEYDKNNPDLVRVQHRNASLAIIPAGSIAVVGWLVAGALLFGLALAEKRLSAAPAPVGATTHRAESAASLRATPPRSPGTRSPPRRA